MIHVGQEEFYNPVVFNDIINDDLHMKKYREKKIILGG